MKWSNGFYFDDSAPDGAVSISDEQYTILIKGQSSGDIIVENDQGIPMLNSVDRSGGLDHEKSNIIAIKCARLTELSKDIVQSLVGESVPDIEQRKEEFIRLHNEIRTLEGKRPRETVCIL